MSARLVQLELLDLRIAEQCNRFNQLPYVSRFFGTVSRLGDGVFWYCLAGMIALLGGWPTGLLSALWMLAWGGTCTVVYKLLKHAIARRRPCELRSTLLVTVAPLDRFSFPSGHTLHAVCFTILGSALVPGIGWFLWPFTLLVALSRLVLGLHFISDVIAGAIIGTGVASLALAVS
jgi:undecaprenyl-diphosphatase